MDADCFVVPHTSSALEQIQTYGNSSDEDAPLDMEPHLSDDEALYISNDENPSAVEDHSSDCTIIDPTAAAAAAEAQISAGGSTFTPLPSTSGANTQQIGNQSKLVFLKT